ncbi:hypothetical protein PG593_04430 [Riemerella anatipestifer]|nr:hypothetical protein [Riemerella anatipestifer]MDY3357406.1 hypothetical protein [Riemerella anatipestifer]MDY3529022.1 hypothetical protein [Riemerella anatipestifer]
MGRSKTVKMRAFRITNNNIHSDNVNVFPLLSEQLKNSTANERRLVLNDKDPNKEEDLICDYKVSTSTIFGALLRIRNGDNIPELPEEIFESNTIHLEELDDLKIESSLFYKDHYYFLLSENYLIVTLRGNVTITHFQTYINWLLESVRAKDLFEFTPIVKNVPDMPLKDIKQITIKDPARQKEDAYELTETKKFSIDILCSMLKDVTSLDEVMLSEVISAELLLKFSKPKKMTNEEYQNYFGAFIKPISDLENVTFYPKKGNAIKAEEIEEIEEVKIETTDSGKISEPELKQVMEKYLNQIENDYKN